MTVIHSVAFQRNERSQRSGTFLLRTRLHRVARIHLSLVDFVLARNEVIGRRIKTGIPVQIFGTFPPSFAPENN